MNERSSTLSFGLGEATLKWVARNPFRTWLVAWLALTWVWLAVQMFFDVPWGSLTPKPPARNQIRYADMEGKRTQSGIVMAFPARVLAADPPIGALKFGSGLQFGEHDGRVIVTAQTFGKFECGWPRPLIIGRVWSAWDVTDLERGYVPAVDIFPRQRRSRSDTSLVWASTDGTKNLRLILQSAAVWFPLALALLPVAPVFLFWLSYEVRQRRRRKRGACLACGHQRGPGATSERCAECGSIFVMPAQARRESGFRNALRAARLPALALLLSLAFAGVAFAACWLMASEQPRIEESVRRSAEHWAAYAQQESLTMPRRFGAQASDRLVGWPWPFLITERWRWHEISPDGTLVPVPVDPSLRFRDERPGLDWHVISRDPFVLNWYFVDWRPGALILIVTAFIAGNIIGVMGLLRLLARASRQRSATTPAPR